MLLRLRCRRAARQDRWSAVAGLLAVAVVSCIYAIGGWLAHSPPFWFLVVFNVVLGAAALVGAWLLSRLSEESKVEEMMRSLRPDVKGGAIAHWRLRGGAWRSWPIQVAALMGGMVVLYLIVGHFGWVSGISAAVGAGLLAAGRLASSGEGFSCARCGYEKGETNALLCPECGAAWITADGVALGSPRPEAGAMAVGAVVLLAGLVLAVLDAAGVV